MGCTRARAMTAAAASAGLAVAGCNLALGLDPYFGPAGASGTGQTLWSTSFGDSADQTINSVAVGPDGHIFITGQGNGFIGFGCPVAAGNSALGYLVELDAGGACVWTFFFGGAGPPKGSTAPTAGSAVAVDAAGHIVLAGIFAGAITLPAPGAPWTVDTGSAGDAFVMRFEAGHTVDWVRVLTSGANGAAVTLAVALGVTADEIVLGAQYTGSLALESPPPGPGTMMLQQGSGGQDVLVLLLDKSATVVDQLGVGGPQDQTVHGVAVRSDDAFAVTGQTTGMTTLNGVSVGAPSTPSAFLAVYDRQKAPLLQGIFPGDLPQLGKRVALDDTGSTFLVGELQGSIGFADGGPTLTDPGAGRAFVTGFHPGGQVIGALQIVADNGGDVSATSSARALGLDGRGAVVLGGTFSGRASLLDAAPVTATGASSAYVAKVDVTLTKAVWLEAFTDPTGDATADQGVDGVAGDGAGNTVVVGHFTGSLDCGKGTRTLVSHGLHDIFVAKLGP